MIKDATMIRMPHGRCQPHLGMNTCRYRFFVAVRVLSPIRVFRRQHTAWRAIDVASVAAHSSLRFWGRTVRRPTGHDPRGQVPCGLRVGPWPTRVALGRGRHNLTRAAVSALGHAFGTVTRRQPLTAGHSRTQSKQRPSSLMQVRRCVSLGWWAGAGSNRRPSAFQA